MKDFKNNFLHISQQKISKTPKTNQQIERHHFGVICGLQLRTINRKNARIISRISILAASSAKPSFLALYYRTYL
jgi:hypothetical protein